MTAAILPIQRGKLAITAALMVCFAPTVPAQTSTASATLSVDVNVVTLPVSVRDKKGQIVRNLTKDDFDLQENGKPESIRYFSQETDLPLTLGLLVDTSLSERNVLDQERTASKSFLDQMMTRPKDKAFLIHFDREVELLQDLTPSKEKLESALQLLQTPDRNSDTSSDPDGSSRHTRGGGTTLYDSVFLAANDVIKKQPGRKALIILSDGDDRGSKETLNTAIEAAQRADTVVYAIYFAEKHREGDRDGFPGGGRRGGGGYPGGGYPGGGGGYPGGGGGYPGGGGGYPGGGGGGWPGGGGRRGGGREPEESHIDGKKVLEQMSRETGGRMYEVSKKESVDQIYSQIAEELRTQYMLGYTPDKSNSGSGYRRITLTAKKKDLVVQTRDGYYADR